MYLTEIYDVETLINTFTYTGYVVETNTYYQYVIHKEINQYEELIKHLLRGNFYQVGFNNEAFDYPVEHHLIKHYNEYKNLSGEEIAKKIYDKAQELIIDDNIFRTINDSNKYIFQIDLYKIWHYDNKARRCSLKDLEFALNMENIQEMPFDHTHYCTKEEINTVLSYNKNDVEATTKFFKTTIGDTDYSIYKGKNKLNLRSQFKKLFNIPCYNWSDVKIGEQLIITLYCRENHLDPQTVKTWKTERDIICLKECIPKWCNIKSKEFNNFLDKIKLTCISENDKFEYSVIYHNIQFDFGLGGTHGCIKSGIYESDDKNIILDLDISSLYPSIAKSLNLYPEHLGKSFNHLYAQFIDTRLKEKHKPKNERNNALIEGYKLLLNGTYGKSGEKSSALYDPLYKYKTTIAGQIFICMWAERMVDVCPELKFIQINTDGITILIPKDKIDLIRNVYKQLEKETGLSSEESLYKKMIIRDVNNYIAEYQDNTIENPHLKLKGCFEIDKEYHKDLSMKIVPIALKEYFINNIPIETTIRNHKNIFDFCIRLKINQKSRACYNYIQDYSAKSIKLNRTTRYYCSNTGGSLVVYYNGGNQTLLNKGYCFTLFNKFEQLDDYNINYNFYIKEARKILNSVVDNQMELF